MVTVAEIALPIAAVLGTLLGVFVGLPAVGYVLWPITRGVCRRLRIEIDAHDEHDPVLKLEGSLAAGLGMALGVFASVALVGLVVVASGSALTVPRALVIAAEAGGVAGVLFGVLWRFGYDGRSITPQLSVAAFAAGLTAGLLAG